MQTRLKTYREFVKAIVIAHDSNGGFKIICSLKRYKLCESKVKFWNTPATRKTFLAHLYIQHILWEKNIAKNIKRIPGYELLGKRCFYNDNLCVVCDAGDVVNSETGEVIKQLTLVSKIRQHPFKVLITEVQI